MSLINIIKKTKNDEAFEILIHKMLHDIASPLNTVIMGLDMLESEYDKSMLGYTRDGVNKMTVILALFRLLLSNDDSDISILDIKKNFGVLCNFSIGSQNQYIPADIGKIVICIVYAILGATAKISRITCNISVSKIQVLTVAQEVFCDFKSDIPNKKNIFQYLALLIADFYNRKLVAQNTKDGFFVSF